jgi:hypothetical protein
LIGGFVPTAPVIDEACVRLPALFVAVTSERSMNVTSALETV